MAWIMTVLPIVLLLLGFPIFIILLATATVLLVGFMNVPLTQLHLVMFGSIDKFALLSVPFFIFAGDLMGRGGLSKRLVEWVLSIMGRTQGSLALTAVGANTVFGAISGSSAAAVAAIGQLLYGPLREKGYDERFTSGLLTSSGAIALIIPPSIIMILYGYSAEQSITHLFIAGILPGMFIALLMGAYIYVFAARRGIREGEKFSWRRLGRTTRAAAWALGAPVIVLGGMYAGIVSPTEAAGIACVYAIVITRYVYRDISWKGIWDVAISSMYLTSQVLIIVAAAGVFSWLLTVSGVPQSLVQFIESLEVEPWMVLVVINLLLLAVGCLLDPGSAILVLTPLLAPIAKAIGVDLVHFGIIMTVNLSIGMFTPPFGINIFVAQAVFRTPLSVLYPGLAPFIGVNILALVVITYVPQLSLVLTRFVQ
ncbi:MAG TPA: TRAP transporter large permease [Alphaproteobacteria bacterium]|jgi:C4-dicarboxylate transporter DctM subunit